MQVSSPVSSQSLLSIVDVPGWRGRCGGGGGSHGGWRWAHNGDAGTSNKWSPEETGQGAVRLAEIMYMVIMTSTSWVGVRLKLSLQVVPFDRFQTIFWASSYFYLNFNLTSNIWSSELCRFSTIFWRGNAFSVNHYFVCDMAVVVKGGFAGPGAGGVNGTGQQGVWRREITCTEVGHIIITEDVTIIVMMMMICKIVSQLDVIRTEKEGGKWRVKN